MKRDADRFSERRETSVIEPSMTSARAGIRERAESRQHIDERGRGRPPIARLRRKRAPRRFGVALPETARPRRAKTIYLAHEQHPKKPGETAIKLARLLRTTDSKWCAAIRLGG